MNYQIKMSHFHEIFAPTLSFDEEDVFPARNQTRAVMATWSERPSRCGSEVGDDSLLTSSAEPAYWRRRCLSNLNRLFTKQPLPTVK